MMVQPTMMGPNVRHSIPMHTPISKNVARENGDWHLSNGKLHDRMELWFPYLVCKNNGRDPFNQNSNRSDREKRTTLKGGPVFSKLFRSDRTDPLSFGPKFPEILVEWIAPNEFFAWRKTDTAVRTADWLRLNTTVHQKFGNIAFHSPFTNA